MAANTSEKVSLTLPSDVLEYLDEQARERGVTPADVILSALGTDKFVRSKVAATNAEVIVRENGKSSKLQF